MLWSNWEISMNLACSSLKSLSAVSRRSSAPKSMAKLVDLISDAGTISTKERRTSSRMASVGAKGWEWNDCSTRRASSIVEMEGADSSGGGSGRAAVAASAVVGATPRFFITSMVPPASPWPRRSLAAESRRPSVEQPLHSSSGRLAQPTGSVKAGHWNPGRPSPL